MFLLLDRTITRIMELSRKSQRLGELFFITKYNRGPNLDFLPKTTLRILSNLHCQALLF